mgnify:CR=1 FL=1
MLTGINSNKAKPTFLYFFSIDSLFSTKESDKEGDEKPKLWFEVK